MAAPTSIPQLEQLLDVADINQQGLVAWDGTNGLKSILAQLIATVGYRGTLYFETQSQMATAGAADGWFATCPDPSDATVLNFYRFFPNIDNTIPGAVTSSAAGQWRPEFGVNTTTGPWTTSGGNIIPNTGLTNAGVGIGQTSVPANLWLDMPGVDGTTPTPIAKGARLSPMTTAQMNSIITPPDWTLITNIESRMLLMQHPTVGFKSAGVYAGVVVSGAVSGSKITISIPTQFVNSYKIFFTATDSATGVALGAGYYVNNKTSTSFDLNFNSFASGTINLDFNLCH